MRFKIEGDKLVWGTRKRLRGKQAGNKREVKIFKGKDKDKLTAPYKLIISKAIKEHVKEKPSSSFKETVNHLKQKGIANNLIQKRGDFQKMVVKENLTRLSVAEAIQRIKDTHGMPNTTFTFDDFINKLKRNRVINQQSDLTKNMLYEIKGWCNRHNIRAHQSKLDRFTKGKNKLRVFIKCFVYNSQTDRWYSDDMETTIYTDLTAQ